MQCDGRESKRKGKNKTNINTQKSTDQNGFSSGGNADGKITVIYQG